MKNRDTYKKICSYSPVVGQFHGAVMSAQCYLGVRVTWIQFLTIKFKSFAPLVKEAGKSNKVTTRFIRLSQQI